MSFIRRIFPSKEKEKEKDVVIGLPTDFQHHVKVQFDKEKGSFIGLPPGWRQLLDDNKIQYFFIVFTIYILFYI